MVGSQISGSDNPTPLDNMCNLCYIYSEDRRYNMEGINNEELELVRKRKLELEKEREQKTNVLYKAIEALQSKINDIEKPINEKIKAIERNNI